VRPTCKMESRGSGLGSLLELKEKTGPYKIGGAPCSGSRDPEVGLLL
jgi:hypothetical protein